MNGTVEGVLWDETLDGGTGRARMAGNLTWRKASAYMTYGILLFAQTSSFRSFQDCQIELLPVLIMSVALAVYCFAGDWIAKRVKESAILKRLKNKATCTIVAAAVIAVASVFSRTQVKKSRARR